MGERPVGVRIKRLRMAFFNPTVNIHVGLSCTSASVNIHVGLSCTSGNVIYAIIYKWSDVSEICCIILRLLFNQISQAYQPVSTHFKNAHEPLHTNMNSGTHNMVWILVHTYWDVNLGRDRLCMYIHTVVRILAHTHCGVNQDRNIVWILAHTAWSLSHSLV